MKIIPQTTQLSTSKFSIQVRVDFPFFFKILKFIPIAFNPSFCLFRSQLLSEFMSHITKRRDARFSTESEKKTSVGFHLGTTGDSGRLNSTPNSPSAMTRHFLISDSTERDYQAFFDQLALRQRWDYDDNGGLGPLSARRETNSTMRIAIGGPSLLLAPSISASHTTSQNSDESSQIDSSSQSTGVIGSTYVIRQSSSSTPVITRIDHP